MTDPMLPHERLPYSPITERPALTLPGGAEKSQKHVKSE